MAEEKKPKIDLKARLGKTAVGGATPPPPAAAPSAPAEAGSVPAPAASVPVAPPPAVSSGGLPAPAVGLPVPPGVPIGRAPALDPSNPLAAVVAPPQPVAPAAPPAPARIEVDEMAVQEAAKKARRTGFVFAAVTLVAGVGIGFMGGQAQQAGKYKADSRADAADLKKDVDGAKTKMEDLAKALEGGRDSLKAKPPVFPKELANQLGGINVDFDGTKLAGRRFSGFPLETAGGLIDLATAVAALNEHKTAIKNLLTKLEKPLTEQLAAAQAGTASLQYMVLLGGPTGKDPNGNFVGVLSPISPPIAISKEKIEIPNDLKGVVNGGVVTVPKLTSASIDKPGAVYLAPGSVEAIFPSDTKSLAGQLSVKLADLIHELRGDEKPKEDIVTDVKPGLIERAETLSKNLDKVAGAGG
jgi:hypothetical protein